ncbi:MAG: hypothetical protein RLN88_07295 [Ekhidna sp.]|uniref:hypothetical protein n=1 Tax=Ekhidna sp. TaxID=2608089 RepID=UPI0032EFB82F
MTRFTIDIPDEKVPFFKELIKNLGLEKDINIPDEHKQVVLSRIESSKKNPGLLLEWDTIKDDFRID